MPNDADRNSRMSTIGRVDAQFDEAERDQQRQQPEGDRPEHPRVGPTGGRVAVGLDAVA